MTTFTVPGMTDKQGAEVAELLQKALSRYNDLHLTLKHVHWNVVGPNFIGVHEMSDPQVELVRGYADEAAERIAALGTSPKGTPGAIINDRTWDDYSGKVVDGVTLPLVADDAPPARLDHPSVRVARDTVGVLELDGSRSRGRRSVQVVLVGVVLLLASWARTAREARKGRVGGSHTVPIADASRSIHASDREHRP